MKKLTDIEGNTLLVSENLYNILFNHFRQGVHMDKITVGKKSYSLILPENF